MSFSSFEKYVNAAWCFCLWSDNVLVQVVSKQEIAKWWNEKLLRYENSEISRETLRKYLKSLVVFYQFLDCLPAKKLPERLDWIQLPKKSKP